MAKIKNVIKELVKGEWGTDFSDETNGVPVVKTNNLSYEGIIDFSSICFRQISKEKAKKNYLKNGDLLVEKSGGTSTHSVGYVNFFDGQDDHYVSNNFILTLRPDAGRVNPRFLFYQLKYLYETGQFSDCYNKTTGIQNLKVDAYLQKEIKVPSINYQNEVVSILDKLTQSIVVNSTLLKKLDELSKSRFIEMFGYPGLDKKGWGITTLGKCCELNPKSMSSVYETLPVSFVPMASVSENGIVDASIIRPYSEVKKGFTFFGENDVLFAKITPCMENGKGGIATGLSNNLGFGSTEFHVLRPIEKKSDPYWIYVLTSLKPFRDEARSNMTGTGGQLRVPSSFLANYPISCPPIGLQREFAVFVKKVDKLKFLVRQRIVLYTELLNKKMDEHFQ